VTIRFIPNLQLDFNEEEGAYGCVLPALPDTAKVVVHEVFPLAGSYIGHISITTEEEVSDEEMAQLLAEAEETEPPAAEPEGNVIELPKGPAKPRRKRGGPPPTAA
jgi:hypothetical protein